jgi:hypothetical protein
VEAVVSLNESSELWERLAAGGRRFVLPYDWRVIGDKLLRFYEAQRTVLLAHSASQ